MHLVLDKSSPLFLFGILIVIAMIVVILFNVYGITITVSDNTDEEGEWICRYNPVTPWHYVVDSKTGLVNDDMKCQLVCGAPAPDSIHAPQPNSTFRSDVAQCFNVPIIPRG